MAEKKTKTAPKKKAAAKKKPATRKKARPKTSKGLEKAFDTIEKITPKVALSVAAEVLETQGEVIDYLETQNTALSDIISDLRVQRGATDPKPLIEWLIDQAQSGKLRRFDFNTKVLQDQIDIVMGRKLL